MIKLHQHPIYRLLRLDKPIGFLLLLWPTLMALWIAGDGHPSLKNQLIFILGVVVMRPAGCIINDIADRHIDRQVARTKTRPLASGELSIKQALFIFVGLLTIGFLLLIQLNLLTIIIACFALLFSCLYPWSKRVLYFPQLVLGLSWYLSIPMAFAAECHCLPLTCWILYLAAVTWTVAFDTFYGLADRQDDLRIGVKSTAILFTGVEKFAIGLLQLVTVSLLILLGLFLSYSWEYWLAILLAIILFIYQHYLARNGNEAGYLLAFKNNNWVGLVLFIGVFLSAF